MPVLRQVRADGAAREADEVDKVIEVIEPTVRVALPWPPAALSPNASPHWSKRAKARKAYRAVCGWEATLALRAAGGASWARQQAATGKLLVSVEFVPPNRQRRDMDNCIASMKAGFDGLADALGVDDSRFVLQTRMADRVAGLVNVTVSPWSESNA